MGNVGGLAALVVVLSCLNANLETQEESMAGRTPNGALDDAQARRLSQRFRKGVFVIPSLLTTANIFCWFYSVMESLAGIKALALVPLSNGLEFVGDSAALNAAT